MSVKIRLLRTGKRHQPSYRIVATDSKVKRDGKCLEVVGTYNPLTSPAQINYQKERVDYWVSRGAIMSDRVRQLITGQKRLRTKSKAQKPKSEGESEKTGKVKDQNKNGA